MTPSMNAPKRSVEKRILSKFETKALNEERLDATVRLRKDTPSPDHKSMVFRCECDDHKCDETISVSAEEYKRMHHNKTMNFIVVPSHIRRDIEEVMNLFDTYALVSKHQSTPL